ncbi:MAG: Gfo/Idh/MocA family oxidoreductase [Bacteroidetes bacterium]|nr:Gfo/Idh/MocA family oxidoreductase [Bacteroidota bacterium]
MKEQKQVNIAVIGLGQVAQLVHIPIWVKMPNVDVIGVYDTNKPRAKGIAEKLGAKVYGSTDALFNDPEIDAVHICTPTHTHTQYVLEALAAGKHALVERPIARNLQETLDIHQAAKKSDRVVMVGMNHRFRPDAMILKSFLDNHDLGDVYYIRAGWNKPIRDAHSWRLKKAQSGGGVLMDLGIIMVDLALWLTNFPKIESVSAITFHHNVDTVEDTAIFQARFKGGIISIDCSWSPMVESDDQWLRLVGTEGSARLFPFKIHKNMHDNLVDITPHTSDSEKINYKKSYENELRHFIGAVRGIHPATCTPADAVERMLLIDAFYQSAKQGKEIAVSKL